MSVASPLDMRPIRSVDLIDIGFPGSASSLRDSALGQDVDAVTTGGQRHRGVGVRGPGSFLIRAGNDVRAPAWRPSERVARIEALRRPDIALAVGGYKLGKRRRRQSATPHQVAAGRAVRLDGPGG